jgi:hypothetical protein
MRFVTEATNERPPVRILRRGLDAPDELDLADRKGETIETFNVL